VQQSWDTFDKYYSKSDNSPFYAAAIILHPSRRTQYIRHNWKKEWQRPAFQNVKRLWEIYRESSVVNPVRIPSYEADLSRDLDDYDLFARDLNKFKRPASQNEYEDYIGEKPIEISGSPLSWWLSKTQRECWPKLSQMAIDVLSIPAMSAEPERIFSGARRTISWERMQLGEETIEKTECLKSWMRSGLTMEAEMGSLEA